MPKLTHEQIVEKVSRYAPDATTEPSWAFLNWSFCTGLLLIVYSQVAGIDSDGSKGIYALAFAIGVGLIAGQYYRSIRNRHIKEIVRIEMEQDDRYNGEAVTGAN